MRTRWDSGHNRNGPWGHTRENSIHSSVDVVTKAFTEKAAPELDSKRDEIARWREMRRMDQEEGIA